MSFAQANSEFCPLLSRFPDKQGKDSLHGRLSIVAIVTILHASVGAVWFMQPSDPILILNEMTVSLAMEEAEVVQRAATPIPTSPKPKPKIEQDDLAPPDKVEKIVEETPPPQTPIDEDKKDVAKAQMVDTEPDYRADYLNNPRPVYPMLARRMGYHGKVVLNVEVLSEGAVGQVTIYSSSGQEVLDNSALQAVKNWRFVPARQAGRAITKWFLVPINFTLQG
jgi:protein TonB